MTRARRILAGVACAVLVLFAILPVPATAQVAVRSSVTATRIPLGETVTWVVSVDGAMGAEEPGIPALDFARVHSLGQSQNVTWVNGKMSTRTVFQFRLTPLREGSFAIPSVTVRARGRVYSTDPIPIEVIPGQSGLLPALEGGTARLKLVATIEPKEVVVGQPVVLTMRLYQGARLLADPQYAAPETPRFYAEPTGPGRTYYEGSGPSRWLIGERKTVLYPTVAGRLVIGPAHMTCLVADFDAPEGIEVELASLPVAIVAQPLPPAPSGFEGAVMDGSLSATVNRSRVRADESVELTFRLSGTGNIRLAPIPGYAELADFQIFDRQVEDSLDVERGRAAGTKIVRYTLLPRRTGPLALPPVRYVAFAPGAGYRTLAWSGTTIEVEPGLARTGVSAATVRRVLAPTRVPGGSAFGAGRPYLAFGLVALGLVFWLLSLRKVSNPARAKAREQASAEARSLLERLAVVRSGNEPREFWRVAEEALDRIEDEEPEARSGLADLRALVARARYAPGGGGDAEMAETAHRIESIVSQRQKAWQLEARAARPRWAVALAALAALLGAASFALATRAILVRPADSLLEERLSSAAQALEGRHIPEAQAELRSLWDGGARRPGIALDLALASYYERELGDAALWTERARRLDPRHPLGMALERALDQEGAWKGLPRGVRARTTGGEIAFLAAVLALVGLSALAFRRERPGMRWAGRSALVLALGLGLLAAGRGASGEAPGRGIVLVDTVLANAPGGSGDVELEAGRAVWLEGTSAGWTRVRAGEQVRGFIPSDRVQPI